MRATIFIIFLAVVIADGVCQAQPTARDFVEALVPKPGELVPPLWKESEKDRRRLAGVVVTPREEQRLGAQLLASFLKSLRRQRVKISEQGEDVEYLSALLSVFHSRMRHRQRYRKIRVLIVESDGTDARSFPGGTILFSRGMLEFAESEAAVVGVLAHELAHIDRGHQLDGLRRQKLAQSTFSPGTTSPRAFVSAGKLFVSQFMQPFHPEQETEADADAVRWMLQEGYDPMEMAGLFLRMHQRAPERNRRPKFLQTHPVHQDRFLAVRESVRDAGKSKVGLYVGRENLEKRIPKHRQQFPE